MKKVYYLVVLSLFVANLSYSQTFTYTLSGESEWNGTEWINITGSTWTSDNNETALPPNGGSGTIKVSSGSIMTISDEFKWNGEIIVEDEATLRFKRVAGKSARLIMDESSKITLAVGAVVESSSNETGTGTGNSGNNHNYLEIGGIGIDGEDINKLKSPLTVDRAYLIIVLPVDIFYFTATPQKAVIKLDWASSKAWDFSHYELERSADGITFEYLATIDAEENTNWVEYYSCTDREPLNGLSYYRLKAVDIDGQFEYKGVEVVQFAGTAAVKVYPNPANRGMLYVQQHKANDARSSVSLKDNTGRTVYAGTMESSGKAIDTSSLQPGMYVLTVESTAGIQKKHVIIQ